MGMGPRSAQDRQQPYGAETDGRRTGTILSRRL